MQRRPLYVILNFTFIGILSVTVSSSAFAEPDIKSANYWLPFCRQAVTNDLHQGDALNVGACVGMIIGLGYMRQSAGVCPPTGVTPEQAARVVVQYIDQRPARTNESFMALANPTPARSRRSVIASMKCFPLSRCVIRLKQLPALRRTTLRQFTPLLCLRLASSGAVRGWAFLPLAATLDQEIFQA
jgi:hypothetical protein